ncbi:MAG TPA: adenylate/guanylate cyclase domain-containing protein [Candidatus Dormibacteraeota bacterium]
MQQPKTSYARNGDVNIAYQVVGDGPLDLVLVPGFISHLDLGWSYPEVVAFLRRLASFSRLILFDKRGTGLSDPAPGLPTLEERMEDLHAVLDAAGSERAALFGVSEGGPMSILFAATYPERTTAMIIYGSTPRFADGNDGDDPRLSATPGLGAQASVWEALASMVEHWGEGRSADIFAPSFAGDEAVKRGFGLMERASTSPAMIASLVEAMRRIDVTAVLPAIGVPTLVLHRVGDPLIPVEAARYTAELIPGARVVEFAGNDHVPWLGDSDAVLDEVERFLTGARQSRQPDRALATVLFTDIVESTQRASELGDRRWRELLATHDAKVRRQVEMHGGRVVKGLGDGYLATFDGPARAIRCGGAVVEDAGSLGVEIRAGVHTGECELLGDDVGGMAVHIGARIAAKASPGEVLVSGTVRDLVVGSGIEFDERGTHELKGVPGSWSLLAVRGDGGRRDGPARRAPDPLAPNLEIPRRGDRIALRIARSTPSVTRFMSGVVTRRALRKARERQEGSPGAIHGER